MKKTIVIILIICGISAAILLYYSYNLNNRINDISEACGIDFSDVMKNENIAHLKKDGLYVYAEVFVNDSESRGLIEKLTASGYFCCELKKLPNKSFLDWWNVKDRKNVLTYAMTSSTTGDYGTTVPTVTEIDICDIDGENTIIYIGYYKWSLA